MEKQHHNYKNINTCQAIRKPALPLTGNTGQVVPCYFDVLILSTIRCPLFNQHVMQSVKTNRSLMLICCMAICVLRASAQDNKTDNIKAMVTAKSYIFHVKSVTPMKGAARQQTPGYTITVLPDTVKADLPYFGRLYQAAINPSDGGIKFVSADFTYKEKPRKKGGWDVEISPKDSRTVQQVYLTISPDGYTTVNINCSDRQPISYYGFIEAPKK